MGRGWPSTLLLAIIPLTFKRFDDVGTFRVEDGVADGRFARVFHRGHDVTDLTGVKNVHRLLVRREHSDLLIGGRDGWRGKGKA